MDKTLNLRLFRKKNGLTQSTVAEYLGVSVVFISYVESGKSTLPEDKLEKVINNDRGWLLTENMMVEVQPLPAPKKVTESDAFRVKLIPYEARGGLIGDFVDGVHDYDCETVVSPIKGVDFAMTVTGDSMMPEYNPGDRILIKRIDPNLFIEWGRVYVLDTDNGAVLKKLEKADDPEYVTCISINPDVSPFQVNVNAVRGWYRVLMVMSMK